MLRSVDWIGWFLIFSGVGSLSAALSMGPEGDWGSPWVFIPLVYSACSILGFLTWEHHTKRPLVPESVWSCCGMMLVSAIKISNVGPCECGGHSLTWTDTPVYPLHFNGFLWIFILGIISHAGRPEPQTARGRRPSPPTGCGWTRLEPACGLLDAQNQQQFRTARSRSLPMWRQCAVGVGGQRQQLLCLYTAVPDPEHLIDGLGSQYRSCKYSQKRGPYPRVQRIDEASNVRLKQYIIHTLPLHDQVMGAVILQTVTRLGIPLGIGITTSIWSTYYPSFAVSIGSLGSNRGNTVQQPYTNVFIATLSFSAVVVVLAPFTRLGKLGVPSTATSSSLPYMDSGLANINHDGPGDSSVNSDADDGTAAIPHSGSRHSRLIKIQPRKSSLPKETLRDSLRKSFLHLPPIAGSVASQSTGGMLGLNFAPEDETKSHRPITAATAERVIWLVCEDCGESRRMVKPVGDPHRYFYDGAEYSENVTRRIEDQARRSIIEGPPSLSSVYHELEGNSADNGVVVDRRRFALVDGASQLETVLV